jgi:AbrB family looped-hinge helix DNA binding protein
MELTVSSKGQVVIPKRLRDARNWPAGTTLEVEELPQGLLLRPKKVAFFPAASLADVVAAVGYEGPCLSDADIAAALEQMHSGAARPA